LFDVNAEGGVIGDVRENTQLKITKRQLAEAHPISGELDWKMQSETRIPYDRSYNRAYVVTVFEQKLQKSTRGRADE
jgi:hypothetical protein